MEILNLPIEFEWDKYNIEHIRRHKVEPGECEQVFFNIPLVVKLDIKHLKTEERYFALGKTNIDRILMVVFTFRKKKLRVITARDASRKERRFYESQKNSKV